MSVPVRLITGFLGSGKTSFLNHYLENSDKTEKIAIIQNEFSEVNIDGNLIREKEKYTVLEINNGSVFCVCLLGSFIDSLSDFVDEHHPDSVIMEASGLSDPISVGQIFQSPKLKGKVFLDHIWCLVDAVNFDRAPSLQKRTEHQLRSADTIIVNKSDLAGDKTDSILKQVRKINPFAQTATASFGKIELKLSKKTFQVFPDVKEPVQGRPDVSSVVIRSPLEIKPKSWQLFIDRIKTNTFRTKGYLKLCEGNNAFVQGVFDDFTLTDVPEYKGNTELVMIGDFKIDENLQVVFDGYCRI